jgi:DNA-binding NarL/FixJ family response regulator
MSPASEGADELTVYIVEDSAPVLDRLIESVREVPHARVVGSAAAVSEALAGVQRASPRVLILDMQLRGGSGIQLLKQMKASGVRKPEVVIVVTSNPTSDYRQVSHDHGADHFFDKASEVDRVREVLLRYSLT